MPKVEAIYKQTKKKTTKKQKKKKQHLTLKYAVK